MLRNIEKKAKKEIIAILQTIKVDMFYGLCLKIKV